jgi:hypothetical protein
LLLLLPFSDIQESKTAAFVLVADREHVLVLCAVSQSVASVTL